MSTSFTNLLGTFTSIPFTGSGLSTLASATYVTSTSAVDLGSATPLDCLLELSVTIGATLSSNKQVLIFAQISLDGTNYSTGPTSGTTTTEEPDLYLIGSLPMPLASVSERKSFSMFQTLGFCPRYFKPVIKNETGAALTAGTLNYVPITGVGT